MWPPASPSFNPMDFSVWSMLKVKDTSVAHPSVEALKPFLLREWFKTAQETLNNSVGNFRQKIKLLIEMMGHYVENK